MSAIKFNENFNYSDFFNHPSFTSAKSISVELCPNRKLDGKALKSLSPTFCSITWHVNSDLVEISQISSINLAREIKSDGLNVLIHLSCRYLDKLQALRILNEFKRLDLKNIFVVQGDLIPGCTLKNDFQYASDFIKFIRQNFTTFFNIGVAAYVDTHPNSGNSRDDLLYLKQKVDAGADFIITQMVFDCEAFCNFSEQCRQIDISVPIIPGLYIINSYNGFSSMSKFCQVNVPQDIVDVLTANKYNSKAIEDYGVDKCAQLITSIFAKKPDVQGIHFFSLNNIELVEKVCKTLKFCKLN